MMKSITLGLLLIISSISYATTNQTTDQMTNEKTQTHCLCGKKISSKQYVKSKEYKIYACSSSCKKVMKKNVESVTKKLKKSGSKLEKK
jgi:hypothetical protein